MSDFFLEACCGSAEDAIAAWKGGAVRCELCSDLFHGGLTPSMGALRTVKKEAPGMKIICMVRPREGGFCYTDTEFQVMLEDAAAFLENGADGIVFGILKADGTVDEERCRKMLQVIGDKESVFHRAIDVTPDIFEAMEQIAEMGFTRILTSGRRPTVPEGAQVIREMIEQAAGRIQIMPGGGINVDNIRWCRQAIGCDWYHAAMHRTAWDRSTAGNTDIYYGGAVYPPEDRFQLTHSEDVSVFLRTALD